MRQVLVIKNERSLAKKIVSGLKQEGHFILKLHNENEGLNIVYEQDWDIIILDWDSLSMSGEICRQIRLVKMTPIIIVTDNISSKDCVAGLQAGADDYIRKPFAKEELVARVQAILRRSDYTQQNEPNFVQFKDLLVDVSSNIVKKAVKISRLRNASTTYLYF